MIQTKIVTQLLSRQLLPRQNMSINYHKRQRSPDVIIVNFYRIFSIQIETFMKMYRYDIRKQNHILYRDSCYCCQYSDLTAYVILKTKIHLCTCYFSYENNNIVNIPRVYVPQRIMIIFFLIFQGTYLAAQCCSRNGKTGSFSTGRISVSYR